MKSIRIFFGLVGILVSQSFPDAWLKGVDCQGWHKVDRIQYVPATGYTQGSVKLYVESYPNIAFIYPFSDTPTGLSQSKTILAILLTAKTQNLEFALITSYNYCQAPPAGSYTFSTIELKSP
jgi:hypothetical protein